jgi:hypothetical protein
MEKKCTLCGSKKPLTEFYRAVTKDGLANQCIPCVKARARIRNIVKKEEIRQYDRQRSKLPHRIEARARALQKEKQDKPDRVAARYAVSNAVRDGRLRKMDCAFCGSTNTVAHHHDYAKPLDVTWLCNPCHNRFHALELMAKNAEAVK